MSDPNPSSASVSSTTTNEQGSGSPGNEAAPSLPPGWTLRTSRTTGKPYYFNHHENIALWKDDTLAPGWGLKITDTGRYFVHLETLTSVTDKPTPGNEPPLSRPRKRQRQDEHSQDGTSTHNSASEGRGASGRAEILKHPKLQQDELIHGWLESVPATPRYMDYSQFGEAHKMVLKQLITQTTDIVLDFGAGTGASTEFILEYTYQYRPLVEDEDDLCKIWSIDFWDKDFVIRCYDYFGLKETADAYRKIENSLYYTFCANFARGEPENGYYTCFNPRVIPVKMSALKAWNELTYMGLAPKIVYVDCELDYTRLKQLLVKIVDKVKDSRRGCHIVGGGWDASEGVRKAVREIASAKQLRLHVEQGKCWTFSGQWITQTQNSIDDLSMISEGGGSSSAQIFQLDDVQGWVQNVATIIRDRDRDVDDLRRKLQGHGKERKDGKWVAHSKTWIDTEANDKRRLTPLMHAVKCGRFDYVTVLVDEFGAEVNAQSSRSKYTPIIQASYAGNNQMVKYLLDHGADPLLENKWGENAIKAAEKNSQAETAQLIRKHLEEKEH